MSDRPGKALRFETLAIHAGQDPDPATGATITPVYQTVTYTHDAVDQNRGFAYSRSGNPTRAALESCLAALEGGRFCLDLPRVRARPTLPPDAAERYVIVRIDNGVSRYPLLAHLYDLGKEGYRLVGIERPESSGDAAAGP